MDVFFITRNMMKLKEGMGEKLGVVANLAGTAILCLCQSFPMGWELTLACITVVPFSITASIILSNVSNLTKEDREYVTSKGAIFI